MLLRFYGRASISRDAIAGIVHVDDSRALEADGFVHGGAVAARVDRPEARPRNYNDRAQVRGRHRAVLCI